jgi:hypothetical protein
MKNIFSASELTPELHDFTNQRQAGQQPTAPSCNPTLPVSELAPLPEAIERIAEIAAPTSPIRGR